jgi:hypothetical protein
VLTAVELDHQSEFRTAEISDEWADGMLAAELLAAESTITQPLPELPLRIRLIVTESARVATQMLLNLPLTSGPLTLPSPPMGERVSV